jgi:plasmid stability protein
MNSYVIDLSDETYDLLKEQASAQGVSMEEEAKALLDAWYRKDQASHSDNE